MVNPGPSRKRWNSSQRFVNGRRFGSDAEKGRRLPFDRNRRRISRRSAGFYCEEKKIKCRGAVSVVFPFQRSCCWRLQSRPPVPFSPRLRRRRNQLLCSASRRAVVSRSNWATIFCSLRFSVWRNANRLIGRQLDLPWFCSGKLESTFAVFNRHIMLIAAPLLFCYAT
jgi:hypothetical protein